MGFQKACLLVDGIDRWEAEGLALARGIEARRAFCQLLDLAGHCSSFGLSREFVAWNMQNFLTSKSRPARNPALARL